MLKKTLKHVLIRAYSYILVCHKRFSVEMLNIGLKVKHFTSCSISEADFFDVGTSENKTSRLPHRSVSHLSQN